MNGQKLTRLLAACVLVVVIASGVYASSVPDQRTPAVNVLVMVPRNYGANLNLYVDNFEVNGWHVTFAGTSDSMPPCPVFAGPRGCLPIAVDTLVSEIGDITAFDGLAIMSGSASAGSACPDLLASEAALNLIRAAVDSGMAVGAWCTAVRVLAAADVLDGIHVTGSAVYQAEYTAAGAIWEGTGIPPVTDGNIMTCSKGDYYNIQNTNAFAILMDNCQSEGEAGKNQEFEFTVRTAGRPGDVLWETTFGGEQSDGARAICSTIDGGNAMAGFTYSVGAGSADVFVLRIDGQGNQLWAATGGGAHDDRALDICSTSDGGFLAVGYTHSIGAGSWDVFATKIDSSGNQLWARTYGGSGIDVGTACLEAPNGDYLLCGYTESYAVGEDDVYLIRIDANGEELWSQTYGGTDTDMGQAVTMTSDGGFIIAGSSGIHTALGLRYMYLVKTDAEGNLQWTRLFTPSGGVAYSSANSIVETSDGGFIIAGDADEIAEQDLRGIILAKVNSAGTVEWIDRFGRGSYYDSGWDALQADDGSILLVGASKDASTMTSDVYAVLADAQGNELWHRTFGDAGPQWGSAACGATHSFLISGHTAVDFGGPYDVWLLKISNLFADFEAEPSSGHAPVTTQFTDASLGDVVTWEWDFDNDGTIDSELQHPIWTYDEPGTYTVSFKVGDGEHTDTLMQADYVRVFDGESALWFDGTDGAATCTASPSLTLVDAVTVEAWIYPEGWGEVPTTGYGRIVDKDAFALYLHGDGSTYNQHALMFLVKNESGPPRVITTPANSIHLDGWQHVATSYDASTEAVEVFINGFLQDLTCPGTPSGPIRDNSDADLVIGNNEGNTCTFSGVIDELRVWNVARTSDQIQEAMGSYLAGDEAGLVGYWSMNEGYGPVIEDGSPHGNIGEITGASWRQGTPFVPTVPVDEWHPVYMPHKYALHCSYPNPFAPSTTIRYELPKESHTLLAIYDVAGRVVRTLVNEIQGVGHHCVSWNGENDTGRQLASGIYFCHMESGHFSETRKVLLVR